MSRPIVSSSLLLALVCVLIALAATPSVNAWGVDGHQAVATIAYNYLTPKAKAGVDKIINNSDFTSIEDASTWPDRAKTTATGGWHYIDGEDSPLNGQCSLSLSRDCPDTGCVVSAIADAANTLKTGSDATDLAHALAYLVHFVGDAAQPLHASGYSKGGNGVTVKFSGASKNLHSVWDSAILLKTISSKYSGSHDKWVSALIASATQYNTAAGVACASSTDPTDSNAVETCVMKWATESNQLVCSTVYKSGFSKTVDLSGAYYKAVAPVVDAQVTKAGVRLAAMLNKILG
ncbi:hypothetical protein GGF32_004437 [Allomyces javanicus]|nr:hypothetical protein GGF32_004437 [Allomyces javanicus]